jgi:hypothetical protein
MKYFFTHILTGKDNKTYDIGRVTWLLGVLAIIFLASYEVMTSTVNLREFAESLGIVSGAGGAGIYLKKETEPE